MKVVVAIVACALGACGFDVNPGADRDGGGSGSDARDSGSGSGSDGGPPIDVGPPVACSSPITSGLVACFELEDGVTDGTLRDSSPALADATTMGLLPAQRTKPATSAAADVTNTVATYVADSPRFDLASGYTAAMWVMPARVPPTSRTYGLYDHELQYAAVIAKAGGSVAHLRCINTGQQYEYTSQLPVGTWSFIACTWDGLNLCAQYWSSSTDKERFCTVPSGIAADGMRGLAIGHLSSGGIPESPLEGSFDSLQLYDHALSTDELCAIIGEPANCFL